MRLYPALRLNGRVIKGQPDDSHITLAFSHDLPEPPESQRGFTPDGKVFFTRKQALGFLKKHDIKTFRKLPSRAYYDGLHSEHLAKAYGIDQKPEAEKITEQAIEIAKLKGEDNVRSTENQGIPESGKDVGPKEGTNGEQVDLSTKTAIVYDRGGLYLYCAEKLAQSYGKVYYYLADADAYPSSQKHTIGMGIPKVKRVHDFFKYIDKADIVYFFDCYDGELQHWLRSKGYTVFGSGRGEQVEIDKILFLETLEKLGLPCPKTYLAEGMDDLKKYLEEHDGETLWLKNLHRGDFETRKFKSMAQIKPFLDDLRKRIGTASDTVEVLVQHKIDSACEVGYDGFQVDGQFTKNCIVGYEIKDKGFVAKVFDETPEIVGCINDAFSDTFKRLGYRGNYSTEIRVTEDGSPYYIDATCRVPSPPGELMCELYASWAEDTYAIAQGTIPELKPKAKYGAEIILTSSWYDHHELHVKFPKEIAQYVKLKNHTIRDGEYYCVPNGNGEFFGAVVAWDDTLEGAIKKVLKYAEQVEADELEYDASLFDAAKESIKCGEKFGVNY